MRIDPPRHAWYRSDERPPAGHALAEVVRDRDAATARALRAYLATRPVETPRRRVQTAL